MSMLKLAGPRSWTLVRGAAVLFFALCVNGCSSDSSPSPADTCQPEEATAHPPVPPDAGNLGSTDNVVFAIRNLILGYEGADGTWSKDAWASYGYDLDGVLSPGCPGSHCQPREGATRSSIERDGPGGLDNSFGYDILLIYHSMRSDYSTRVRESMQRGDHTLLLAIDGLGSASNATGLHGAIYEGAPLGHSPAWDGTDVWPVFCEYLETCLSTGTPSPPGNASKMRFENAYVADGVLVVRPDAPIVIGLNWLGGWFPLRLHNAIITLRLEQDGVPQSATDGVIAGVLDTAEYVNGVHEHRSEFCLSIPGYCQFICEEGPTKASVLRSIEAASDIMKDGSQDPASPCDGISVGLGFEATAVKLGPAMDRQPPPLDPCTN